MTLQILVSQLGLAYVILSTILQFLFMTSPPIFNDMYLKLDEEPCAFILITSLRIQPLVVSKKNNTSRSRTCDKNLKYLIRL